MPFTVSHVAAVLPVVGRSGRLPGRGPRHRLDGAGLPVVPHPRTHRRAEPQPARPRDGRPGRGAAGVRGVAAVGAAARCATCCRGRWGSDCHSPRGWPCATCRGRRSRWCWGRSPTSSGTRSPTPGAGASRSCRGCTPSTSACPATSGPSTSVGCSGSPCSSSGACAASPTPLPTPTGCGARAVNAGWPGGSWWPAPWSAASSALLRCRFARGVAVRRGHGRWRRAGLRAVVACALWWVRAARPAEVAGRRG